MAAIAATAMACGGNGNDQASRLPTDPYPSLAAKCAAPRSGTDPFSGQVYPDKPGSLADEKAWLLGWSQDLYLWYRDIPQLDPSAYPTAVDWFDALKSSQITASGKEKDQFHFSEDTASWQQLSEAGLSAGYGANFDVVAPYPPRRILVAYTDPGTPADAQAVGRGAEVLAVDGVDAVNAGSNAAVDTLNAGLFPAGAGETHSFIIRDLGSSLTRTVTLTSAVVASTPVQDVGIVAPGVGYLLFNAHVATAERQLIDAVQQLHGINDLVLDLRYNGGGLLDIASELAFMIAGPAQTAGKTFEQMRWNDKHPSVNPVTNRALTPIPFESQAVGFTADVTPGAALPHLDLTRVFVLSTASTCSASEAIINGLRGAGVQVVLIGDTTCGKPYGFYPQDNCGTTWFTIEFQSVNAAGFGDYADGFVPNGLGATGILGCEVADDLSHNLGDVNERLLGAALQYRSSQTCPPPGSLLVGGPTVLSGHVIRPPALTNRIYRAATR
jgi:C-terminal processing protease CtpA/Prc